MYWLDPLVDMPHLALFSLHAHTIFPTILVPASEAVFTEKKNDKFAMRKRLGVEKVNKISSYIHVLGGDIHRLSIQN
jgi:hypothetical protein